MRIATRTILAFLFVLLILGAAEPPIPLTDHAGTQADPMLVYNSQTVGVLFDDRYTGTTVTLARVDVEVANEAGVVQTTWALTSGWFVEGAAIRVPIRTYAEPLPNGIYQIRVRIWDTYGNVSAWAPTVWVSKQWRTLEPPGGCRTVG